MSMRITFMLKHLSMLLFYTDFIDNSARPAYRFLNRKLHLFTITREKRFYIPLTPILTVFTVFIDV